MKRDLKEPTPVLLVVAVFWQPKFEENFKAMFKSAQEWTGLEFGLEVGKSSAVFDFTQTTYYEGEMGKELKKVFVQLGKPVSRDSLASFKVRAREIEDQFSTDEGARLVNIDPMLISVENVIVASSKNFPHRLYLGQGVFGDLQLIRRRTGYEALPWTYKDYVEQIPYFEGLGSN
jgi:hypothetical protein